MAEHAPLLTSKEAMRYLRVSEKTLYLMLREGQLTGSKVGRCWRFTKEQLKKAVRCLPFIAREEPKP